MGSSGLVAIRENEGMYSAADQTRTYAPGRPPPSLVMEGTICQCKAQLRCTMSNTGGPRVMAARDHCPEASN